MASQVVSDLPVRDASKPAGLSGSDLSDLFSAFNDVTGKLQETHERLTGEVSRLKTELRRANDELERSRRLAALGQMAAGISHEVRNPLASIGLYAEMLVADLADRPEERRNAEKILGAVQGLDAVVNDVLSFSREMRTEQQDVSAADAFERALHACRDCLSDVHVRVECGDATLLHCDSLLLQQALVNLIRNAADAMERDGTLVLGAALTHTDDGEPRVALSVSDTGPGVDDDVKQRMFNPFFTTRAAGTGLGLAIVHRIVDAHGGTVRVSNRVGTADHPSGAVITLVLPAAPSTNQEDIQNRKAGVCAGPRSAA